jgi:hypothetical protein
MWYLGQNERNLKELLAATERRLTADSYSSPLSV